MISKRMDRAIVVTLLATKIVFLEFISPTVASTRGESALLATATDARNHLARDPVSPTRKNSGNEEVNGASDRRSIGNDNRWDAVPGIPGTDYPDHEVIPATSFTCLDKRPGGYYADVETGCQVFHVCNIGGMKSSFLCPTGSIFNQRYFVCDWWYSFDCTEARYHDESFDSTSGSPESTVIGSTNFTNDPIVVPSYGLVSSSISESSDNVEYHDEQNASNDIIGIGYRESLSKISGVESFEAKNDGNGTMPVSNHDRDDSIVRAKAEKVPRGFSLYRDDDRDKRITNNVEFDNDIAAYVNYAYFEVRSNESYNKSK